MANQPGMGLQLAQLGPYASAAWIIDGEYDWPTKCCQCQVVLEEGGGDTQTTRLSCLSPGIVALLASPSSFVHHIVSNDQTVVARDSFEGMIETLSRTKESIGRATRHAIDCKSLHSQ